MHSYTAATPAGRAAEQTAAKSMTARWQQHELDAMQQSCRATSKSNMDSRSQLVASADASAGPCKDLTHDLVKISAAGSVRLASKLKNLQASTASSAAKSKDKVSRSFSWGGTTDPRSRIQSSSFSGSSASVPPNNRDGRATVPAPATHRFQPASRLSGG